MTTTVNIHGFCDERFKPLEDAFRANFDDGLELGSSLGVTHQGKMVVDLWGGWADPEKTRPWEEDTIVPIASSTKIMATIVGLMLVDRGVIELDAPIATYWPEFAQGGKAHVTIRDAFSHQTGAPGFDPPVAFEAMHDWDGITARLAAEPHWFGGERKVIYHGMTYGLPLGVAMQRLDGRRPAQFFREEVAQKCGADLQMMLTSKSDLQRVATILPPSSFPALPPGSLLEKLMISVGPGDRSSWEHQSAEVPAASGHGNGRSIARVCAIMAMGGTLDGVRYLSRATVEEAALEQAYGEDDYLGWLKMG